MGTRQDSPLLLLLLTVVLEALPSAKGQKNDIKGIKIGKEEIKPSLLTDDILIII